MILPCCRRVIVDEIRPRVARDSHGTGHDVGRVSIIVLDDPARLRMVFDGEWYGTDGGAAWSLPRLTKGVELRQLARCKGG